MTYHILFASIQEYSYYSRLCAILLFQTSIYSPGSLSDLITSTKLDQNKPLANCWTAIYRQEFLNLNDPVMGRKQKVWWSNWWFFAFCLKTIKYKSNEVHCYEIDCFSIRSWREWLPSHSFPLLSFSWSSPGWWSSSSGVESYSDCRSHETVLVWFKGTLSPVSLRKLKSLKTYGNYE